jgi:hypothetical protein
MIRKDNSWSLNLTRDESADPGSSISSHQVIRVAQPLPARAHHNLQFRLPRASCLASRRPLSFNPDGLPSLPLRSLPFLLLQIPETSSLPPDSTFRFSRVSAWLFPPHSTEKARMTIREAKIVCGGSVLWQAWEAHFTYSTKFQLKNFREIMFRVADSSSAAPYRFRNPKSAFRNTQPLPALRPPPITLTCPTDTILLCFLRCLRAQRHNNNVPARHNSFETKAGQTQKHDPTLAKSAFRTQYLRLRLPPYLQAEDFPRAEKIVPKI